MSSKTTPQLNCPHQAAREFEAICTKAEQGDPEALARLEASGRKAAEAFLAQGDIVGAAEILARAKLYDQAVNLYVNLLGDPAAAARLQTRRGDHARAAELYASAGVNERALESWLAWSTCAADPLDRLAEVARLGVGSLVTYLERVAADRPARDSNLELHYRIGEILEQYGAIEPARRAFERLAGASPSYRDVPARLLRHGAAVPNRQRLGLSDKLVDPMAATMFDFKVAGVVAGPADEQRAASGSAVDLVDSWSTLPPDRPAYQEALEPPAVEQLADEVVQAAAKQAAELAWATTSTLPPAPVDAQPRPKGATKQTENRAGAVGVLLPLVFGGDAAQREARIGPSPAELARMIAGHPANLENVELYYRLGLSLAAVGKWAEARAAFRSVEEASPGCHDAAARAEEIGKWRKAVPEVLSGNSFVREGQPRRYKIEGEIGRGSRAVMYRAKDEEQGRDVALKYLLEPCIKDPSRMEVLVREARAVVQLNHTNIATVYDVGVIDDRLFICTELVIGTTVETILEHSGRMIVFEALRIAEAVLCALEHAHGKGIIHRNIKPSNIVRNELGVVKLMDFALGLPRETCGKSALGVGAANYMSPEQLAGKDLDSASDLFAISATLYEMLTGCLPFEGATREKAPSSLIVHNNNVPRVLDRLLLRGLELEKSRRFQQALEMLRPIRQIITSVSAYQAKRPSLAPKDDIGAPESAASPPPTSKPISKPPERKSDRLKILKTQAFAGVRNR